MCDNLPNTILGDDIALVAENMEAILRSPSYSLAQDDRALLERTEMRGVRMLLELGKPELAFQEDNIESTDHCIRRYTNYRKKCIGTTTL